MSTFRAERRWSRTGREWPRIDTPTLIFLAMIGAVFATCFAIGRVTSAGSTSAAEASARLEAAPVSAAIPVRLTTAPRLSLEEPAPPKPEHAARHRAAPPVSSTSASGREPSESAPAVESQPAPAPEPAPTRSAPAPSSKSSPSHSGSSGGHSGSSSGGSSFESSG